MASTDFYDDDLIRQRDRAARIKMGPGDEPAAPKGAPAEDGVSRPVSDFNLTRMARHKQEVDEQASRALQEIEMLRKRQEQLEQEKRGLEDARRKQEEFERGKRDLTGNFRRSLTMLDRDYVEMQRHLELMASTRSRFRERLEEIESIQEDAWPEDKVHDELLRALVVIEDGRNEYNKGMARLEAVNERRPSPGAGTEDGFDQPSDRFRETQSLVHWVKIGAGVTAPLILTLILLAVVYFLLAMYGWI